MPEIVRMWGMDETDELFSMAIGIFSIPRVVLVEAIVVIPGLIGEDYRVKVAIDDWEANRHPNAKHLLIPGHIKENPTSLALDNLQKTFGLKRLEGVISTPFGQNTKIQADWLAYHIETLKIQTLAFYCSSFHMVRAYLTVLKSMLVRNLKPIMIPIVIASSPFDTIAAVGTSSWSLIHGEIARIHEYQAKGDVASFIELMNYLQSVWERIAG